MPKKFLCPKCKEVKPATRHHILPRRWFGQNSHIVLLCQVCHQAIEKVISQREKGKQLEKSEYFKLTTHFLSQRLPKKRKFRIKDFFFRRR